MNLKIKVCGMRETENIKELILLKPDFIGFIFHEKSSRNITEIPKTTIPKTIKKVGVFVDKPMDYILDKNYKFQLNFVQLHGNESPEFCKKLHQKKINIIKAFNIDQTFDFNTLENYKTYCSYFLFDAKGKMAGGNGITFNWNLLHKYQNKTPFLLSGGIDETMINKIKNLKHRQFKGIDINSKFEIKPAFKDINKIKKLITEIKK